MNDEDDLGFTALMWAASESTPEIVKALINAGANLDARDSELCLTALEMAGNPEIISILTDARKKTAPPKSSEDGKIFTLNAKSLARNHKPFHNRKHP